MLSIDKLQNSSKLLSYWNNLRSIFIKDQFYNYELIRKSNFSFIRKYVEKCIDKMKYN